MRILSLTVVFVSLLACGGSEPYHCDFRTGDSAEPRCQERAARVASPGVSEAAFQQTCELVQATSGDGACPLDGAVAGCDVTFAAGGETVVDWYYAPETVESVTETCDAAGGTVLLP
ncbi:MAG: hypothetical protein H6734_24655 [Alphaproteobacteria bacterium]|nr:hypothetical protein [Alphaproteobacteria bacterium]